MFSLLNVMVKIKSDNFSVEGLIESNQQFKTFIFINDIKH